MAFISAQELHLGEGEVAMALAPGTYGSHAGIVYRSDPTRPALTVLHLLANEFVRAEAFYPGKYCWVAQKFDITESRGLILAESLREMERNLPKLRIKYGVNVLKAEGSFVDNEYKCPDESDGLTCATFVWQLLSQCALKLIRPETWPTGVNSKWVTSIALGMIFGGPDYTDLEQGSKVFNQREVARRVKPTELGVPTNHPHESWPFTYEQVQPEEPAVTAILNKFCPVPPTAPLVFVCQT